MKTKICKKCCIEKDIKEFRKSYSSLRKKYYYRNKCKECERKENNEYNRRRSNKIMPLHKFTIIKSKR